MTTVITKRPIAEAFPEYDLLTVYECLARLDWTPTHQESEFAENGTGPITCSCGGVVRSGGWVGAEHATCYECGKGMQDMTGFLPTGNASTAMYDFEKFEVPTDGRHWTPINVWGWRK